MKNNKIFYSLYRIVKIDVIETREIHETMKKIVSTNRKTSPFFRF